MTGWNSNPILLCIGFQNWKTLKLNVKNGMKNNFIVTKTI